MKKTVTALAAALLCLFLAGCAEITVDCGVGENHTAYLKIDLTVDLSGLSDDNAREASNRLRQLGDYYRDTLGFTVTGDAMEWIRAGEPVHMVMTREKEAESYPAAFEELKAMLCDEKMTPFTKGAFSCHDDEIRQGYIARVTLNAHEIWEAAGTENFPKALAEKLEAARNQCTGTLRLTLPATQVEEYSGALEQENGFVAAAVDISFDGATELRLSTRAVLENGEILPAGGEMPEERLEKEAGRLKILCAAAACIFAASLIFMAVSLAARKSKKRKKP